MAATARPRRLRHERRLDHHRRPARAHDRSASRSSSNSKAAGADDEYHRQVGRRCGPRRTHGTRGRTEGQRRAHRQDARPTQQPDGQDALGDLHARRASSAARARARALRSGARRAPAARTPARLHKIRRLRRTPDDHPGHRVRFAEILHEGRCGAALSLHHSDHRAHGPCDLCVFSYRHLGHPAAG